MHVIAFTGLTIIILMLLFTLNRQREEKFSLEREVEQFKLAVKDNEICYKELRRLSKKDKLRMEVLAISYESQIKSIGEMFQESQDKLATIQTAFMEYKKSKGEYNEKEFEVYL